MIKYSLSCECGHSFESWFLNSSEYDRLLKKKLVVCDACNSSSVKKSIMAPNLTSKSNVNFQDDKLKRNIRKKLLEIRSYVEKNCKYVGDSFTREARIIHYDKKTSQNIYGKATPEEAAELQEEGIEVTTIPWVDKSEN